MLFFTKRLITFMKNHLESNAIRRVMVGTDRSETADRAVHWAAGFADRYDAELFVVQVVVPQYPSATEFGAAEQTRAAAANNELARFARQVAGERGHALVVIDVDPALAIVRAVEQEASRCPGGRQFWHGGTKGVFARQRTEPHQSQCPLHRDYREHLGIYR